MYYENFLLQAIRFYLIFYIKFTWLIFAFLIHGRYKISTFNVISLINKLSNARNLLSRKNLEMKLGKILGFFAVINADLIGWNRGINNYSRFGASRTSQFSDMRYQLMVQAKDHPEKLQKMMKLMKIRRKRSTANQTEPSKDQNKFKRFRNFHK